MNTQCDDNEIKQIDISDLIKDIENFLSDALSSISSTQLVETSKMQDVFLDTLNMLNVFKSSKGDLHG